MCIIIMDNYTEHSSSSSVGSSVHPADCCCCRETVRIVGLCCNPGASCTSVVVDTYDNTLCCSVWVMNRGPASTCLCLDYHFLCTAVYLDSTYKCYCCIQQQSILRNGSLVLSVPAFLPSGGAGCGDAMNEAVTWYCSYFLLRSSRFLFSLDPNR